MPDAQILIRRAVPADAPVIFDLHVASIRAHCISHYTPRQIGAWISPKRAENYVRAMEGGEAMFIAEFPDGKAAGFASMHGDEIYAIYVAPGLAGRGIGTALLHALEAQARQSNVRTLRLRSSLNAVTFYERHGYRQVGPGEFRASDVDIPCVTMTRDLA